MLILPVTKWKFNSQAIWSQLVPIVFPSEVPYWANCFFFVMQQAALVIPVRGILQEFQLVNDLILILIFPPWLVSHVDLYIPIQFDALQYS